MILLQADFKIIENEWILAILQAKRTFLHLLLFGCQTHYYMSDKGNKLLADVIYVPLNIQI